MAQSVPTIYTATVPQINSLLNTLQIELNYILDTESQSVSVVKHSYQQLLNLLNESTKIHIKDLELFRSIIFKYIHCIDIYSKSEYPDINFVMLFCTIIKKLHKLSCITYVFIEDLMVEIFTILKDSTTSLLFAKELIISFGALLKHYDQRLVQSSSKDNNIFILQILELLPTCGDFNYQMEILEVIFYICSSKQIIKYAFKLFPHTKLLRDDLQSINYNKGTDYDGIRIFLNHINANNINIFSARCECCILGSIHVVLPKKITQDNCTVRSLWIDCNNGANTLSIICDAECLKDSSISGEIQNNVDCLETITVNATDVTEVIISRWYSEGLSLSKGESVCFNLSKPCRTKYNSSLLAMKAEFLKIGLLASPELVELTNVILPRMFDGKITRISEHNFSANSNCRKLSLVQTTRDSEPPFFDCNSQILGTSSSPKSEENSSVCGRHDFPSENGIHLPYNGASSLHHKKIHTNRRLSKSNTEVKLAPINGVNGLQIKLNSQKNSTSVHHVEQQNKKDGNKTIVLWSHYRSIEDGKVSDDPASVIDLDSDDDRDGNNTQGPIHIVNNSRIDLTGKNSTQKMSASLHHMEQEINMDRDNSTLYSMKDEKAFPDLGGDIIDYIDLESEYDEKNKTQVPIHIGDDSQIDLSKKNNTQKISASVHHMEQEINVDSIGDTKEELFPDLAGRIIDYIDLESSHDEENSTQFRNNYRDSTINQEIHTNEYYSVTNNNSVTSNQITSSSQYYSANNVVETEIQPTANDKPMLLKLQTSLNSNDSLQPVKQAHISLAPIHIVNDSLSRIESSANTTHCSIDEKELRYDLTGVIIDCIDLVSNSEENNTQAINNCTYSTSDKATHADAHYSMGDNNLGNQITSSTQYYTADNSLFETNTQHVLEKIITSLNEDEEQYFISQVPAKAVDSAKVNKKRKAVNEHTGRKKHCKEFQNMNVNEIADMLKNGAHKKQKPQKEMYQQQHKLEDRLYSITTTSTIVSHMHDPILFEECTQIVAMVDHRSVQDNNGVRNNQPATINGERGEKCQGQNEVLYKSNHQLDSISTTSTNIKNVYDPILFKQCTQIVNTVDENSLKKDTVKNSNCVNDNQSQLKNEDEIGIQTSVPEVNLKNKVLQNKIKDKNFNSGEISRKNKKSKVQSITNKSMALEEQKDPLSKKNPGIIERFNIPSPISSKTVRSDRNDNTESMQSRNFIELSNRENEAFKNTLVPDITQTSRKSGTEDCLEDNIENNKTINKESSLEINNISNTDLISDNYANKELMTTVNKLSNLPVEHIYKYTKISVGNHEIMNKARGHKPRNVKTKTVPKKNKAKSSHGQDIQAKVSKSKQTANCRKENKKPPNIPLEMLPHYDCDSSKQFDRLHNIEKSKRLVVNVEKLNIEKYLQSKTFKSPRECKPTQHNKDPRIKNKSDESKAFDKSTHKPENDDSEEIMIKNSNYNESNKVNRQCSAILPKASLLNEEPNEDSSILVTRKPSNEDISSANIKPVPNVSDGLINLNTVQSSSKLCTPTVNKTVVPSIQSAFKTGSSNYNSKKNAKAALVSIQKIKQSKNNIEDTSASSKLVTPIPSNEDISSAIIKPVPNVSHVKENIKKALVCAQEIRQSKNNIEDTSVSSKLVIPTPTNEEISPTNITSVPNVSDSKKKIKRALVSRRKISESKNNVEDTSTLKLVSSSPLNEDISSANINSVLIRNDGLNNQSNNNRETTQLSSKLCTLTTSKNTFFPSIQSTEKTKALNDNSIVKRTSDSTWKINQSKGNIEAASVSSKFHTPAKPENASLAIVTSMSRSTSRKLFNPNDLSYLETLYNEDDLNPEKSAYLNSEKSKELLKTGKKRGGKIVKAYKDDRKKAKRVNTDIKLSKMVTNSNKHKNKENMVRTPVKQSTSKYSALSATETKEEHFKWKQNQFKRKELLHDTKRLTPEDKFDKILTAKEKSRCRSFRSSTTKTSNIVSHLNHTVPLNLSNGLDDFLRNICHEVENSKLIPRTRSSKSHGNTNSSYRSKTVITSLPSYSTDFNRATENNRMKHAGNLTSKQIEEFSKEIIEDNVDHNRIEKWIMDNELAAKQNRDIESCEPVVRILQNIVVRKADVVDQIKLVESEDLMLNKHHEDLIDTQSTETIEKIQRFITATEVNDGSVSKNAADGFKNLAKHQKLTNRKSSYGGLPPIPEVPLPASVSDTSDLLDLIRRESNGDDDKPPSITDASVMLTSEQKKKSDIIDVVLRSQGNLITTLLESMNDHQTPEFIKFKQMLLQLDNIYKTYFSQKL